MATIEKQSWWVCFGDFGGCFKTAQSRPPCILVWRGRRAEAALGFPWKLWSIFKLGINDLYYTVQDLLRELDVHSRRRQYVSRQSVDKEFPENRDFFFYFIVSSLLREKCKNGFVRIHDYRGQNGPLKGGSTVILWSLRIIQKTLEEAPRLRCCLLEKTCYVKSDGSRGKLLLPGYLSPCRGRLPWNIQKVSICIGYLGIKRNPSTPALEF